MKPIQSSNNSEFEQKDKPVDESKPWDEVME